MLDRLARTALRARIQCPQATSTAKILQVSARQARYGPPVYGGSSHNLAMRCDDHLGNATAQTRSPHCGASSNFPMSTSWGNSCWCTLHRPGRVDRGPSARRAPGLAPASGLYLRCSFVIHGQAATPARYADPCRPAAVRPRRPGRAATSVATCSRRRGRSATGPCVCRC